MHPCLEQSYERKRQLCVTIKLDMSKTYDRVEWDFIEEVMRSLGFSDEWIKKVMKCISSVSYSVLLNECPQEAFKPSRGLRQGDHLSSYLFLLCTEGFSAFLDKEEYRSNLVGFQINKYCPSLTHWFFADDNLIFLKAGTKRVEDFQKGSWVVWECVETNNKPWKFHLHVKQKCEQGRKWDVWKNPWN